LASSGAEWLVEEGIGEDRAVLVAARRIVAARIDWLDPVRTGAVIDAKLYSKPKGKRRGTAQLPDGREVLVDLLPPEQSEGAAIRLAIYREAIAERGRNKLALARPAQDHEFLRLGPSLRETLESRQEKVTLCRPADHRFDELGWDELVEEALSGAVPFAGGSLIVSSTPAMTLIDVDGQLAHPDLCIASIPAIAETLRRFDVGGSIGIDFPSLIAREWRREVDRQLGEALKEWPHERTAMNGFGFVQLVARLERPSLLQRYATDRSGAAARQLLRRAEAVSDPGAILLTCHPAVNAKLKPEWLKELARRSGREIRIELDPALALEAGFAQAVPL